MNDSHSDDYRIESDSLGSVRVPLSAKWGPQTQRAIENFPVSGVTMPRAVIQALAQLKSAAARVNQRMGSLDEDRTRLIVAACEEVATDVWEKHFPVDVFQTGSGTSTNMNVNEVIARLATEKSNNDVAVHPNDHVNNSQSSNDVFPSAVQLGIAKGFRWVLQPELIRLAETCEAKALEFSDVVKAGRTHLMDATPITLGQEFAGFAASLRQASRQLDARVDELCELPLGGTAVGTGLNAQKGFAEGVCALLAEELDLPIRECTDHVSAAWDRSNLVNASSAMRAVAVMLHKIANDIRWMSSGPNAGLGEITLPELQPGSSIMPGKVNPVVPESVQQVCAQVIGNDAAVAFAGTTGTFELNVMMPVMAHNLLESLRLLGAACRLFADRCLVGVHANVERCRLYAESSPALATVLNPLLGYDRVAEVMKESIATRRSIVDVLVDGGVMTREEAEMHLDVERMTRGE